MKRILFIILIVLSVVLFSCKKESEVSVNNNNNKVYVSDPNNIYHKEYTNVVKVNGKFVDTKSAYAFAYEGREEGEYSEEYDIFDAIRNHSLKRVAELIENDNQLINDTISTDESEYSEFMDDSYSIDGATPLIFAIFYRDLGIMKYLLDNNADPYIKDEDGWNAFLWACGTGSAEEVKMLVQAHPDLVDSRNIYDANGLHIASLNDNLEVIKYLVNDLDFDINSTDEDGDGVLYYANDTETTDLLESLGAEN
ncbi:ankyrin repeat domain-containing protein [Brachyspira pilosicoli]|uniref:ankyrin repeat domain-containing protein n=1 Tax=Brachyspira pilosicoli TaxID=52584 RepID=UPI0012F4EDF8|nr:ankyrin repeat domain-containing protein [Brachyspira pilosicoli]